MHEIREGDCLEILPRLETASVDALISDPPYGTTQLEWDQAATSPAWWEQAWRIVRPGGAVVLFASGLYTADLLRDYRPWFKYKWVWYRQGKPTGHLDAKRRPLRVHEDILVFGRDGMPWYNPAMSKGDRVARVKGKCTATSFYNAGAAKERAYESSLRYPLDVIGVAPACSSRRLHPTEKPVSLMQTLVRCYVPDGGVVLDPFAGSGSTGVAALETGRSALLIERDPRFAEVARRRLSQAAPLFVEPKDAAKEKGEQLF